MKSNIFTKEKYRQGSYFVSILSILIYAMMQRFFSHNLYFLLIAFIIFLSIVNIIIVEISIRLENKDK